MRLSPDKRPTRRDKLGDGDDTTGARAREECQLEPEAAARLTWGNMKFCILGCVTYLILRPLEARRSTVFFRDPRFNGTLEAPLNPSAVDDLPLVSINSCFHYRYRTAREVTGNIPLATCSMRRGIVDSETSVPTRLRYSAGERSEQAASHQLSASITICTEPLTAATRVGHEKDAPGKLRAARMAWHRDGGETSGMSVVLNPGNHRQQHLAWTDGVRQEMQERRHKRGGTSPRSISHLPAVSSPKGQ